jgi:hypothetical protein
MAATRLETASPERRYQDACWIDLAIFWAEYPAPMGGPEQPPDLPAAVGCHELRSCGFSVILPLFYLSGDLP